MARKLYNDQYDGTYDEAERPRRSIAWWIFCAPGAALMWYEYMFPGRGRVYASGRRYGNRPIQVFYTLVFYVVAAIVIITVTHPGRTNSGPQPGASGNGVQSLSPSEPFEGIRCTVRWQPNCCSTFITPSGLHMIHDVCGAARAGIR